MGSGGGHKVDSLNPKFHDARASPIIQRGFDVKTAGSIPERDVRMKGVGQVQQFECFHAGFLRIFETVLRWNLHPSKYSVFILF
jgi:hypothetical protein